MLYYEFTVKLKNYSDKLPEKKTSNIITDSDFLENSVFEDDEDDYEEEKNERNIRINTKTFQINSQFPSKIRLFVTQIKKNEIELAGAIDYKNTENPKKWAKEFVRKIGYSPEKISAVEITLNDYVLHIRKAERCSFIDDTDEALNETTFSCFTDLKFADFEEFRIADHKCNESIYKQAAEFSFCPTLTEELDRILNFKKVPFIGHPVHYILNVGSVKTGKQIAEVLTAALYKVGRLRSDRITCLEAKYRNHPWEDSRCASLEMDSVKLVYKTAPGSTVILSPGKTEYESETIEKNTANLDELAKIITGSRRDCLTILLFHKDDWKSKEKLKTVLTNMVFVELSEEIIFQDKARQILVKKAEADNLKASESLLSQISENQTKGYYMTDIDSIYEKWLDDRLSKEVFTQYAGISHTTNNSEVAVGSAYEQFQSLIGLTGVKEIVNQALNYNKFQKMFSNRISESKKPSRHMVFVGNPGTAKTTVARLFAQIMKDNGILSEGKLIEVGRKDLIGKYVGWTAKNVEEAFSKAKNSVLFIDEAYSLCDDRDGMYGDEAINTIVQMMENQREDTIVIFAGYPNKMEKFLDKNPGLRSRIAYSVNFEDYNTLELIQILNLIAKENKMILDADVESKIRPILDQAVQFKDFGNGRFIRNLFERAKIKHASRIMEMNNPDISDEILFRLDADDFEMPDEFKNKNPIKQIGFTA